MSTGSFHTRIDLDSAALDAFGAFAAVFGKCQRKMFAGYIKGANLEKIQPVLAQEFGLMARHVKGAAFDLKGKIASRMAVNREQLKGLKVRVRNAEIKLGKLQKKATRTPKDEGLAAFLKERLRALAAQSIRLESGHLSICFGSRKLFQAQFDLAANGYNSKAEWLAAWRLARARQFFFVGSKSESKGNALCTATPAKDGSLTLRVRLPDSIVKYVYIENVRFAYGHDEVLEALSRNQAITYRFVHDPKGWRVIASTERKAAEPCASLSLGAVGVRIGVGRLYLSETDHCGNIVRVRTVPCNTYGKTPNQRTAVIGDATRAVVTYARQQRKTLVINAAGFTERRKEMSVLNARKARQLSTFACTKIQEMLASRAAREGVPLKETEPHEPSLVGCVKYSSRYGISVQHAAASVIARSGQGFLEKAPFHSTFPNGSGGSLAVLLPVRNRSIVGQDRWGDVRKKVLATLAEWHRLHPSKRGRGRFRAAGGRPVIIQTDKSWRDHTGACQ